MWLRLFVLFAHTYSAAQLWKRFRSTRLLIASSEYEYYYKQKKKWRLQHIQNSGEGLAAVVADSSKDANHDPRLELDTCLSFSPSQHCNCESRTARICLQYSAWLSPCCDASVFSRVWNSEQVHRPWPVAIPLWNSAFKFKVFALVALLIVADSRQSGWSKPVFTRPGTMHA